MSYTLEGDSKKAFSADLTITNTGDAPYTAWELGFEFAEKQTLRNGHDAWWQQDGAAVTASNLPWNGTIQPGETVELGFNGRLNGGGNGAR